MAVADNKQPNSDFRTILVADDDENDILLIERAFRKVGLKNPLKVVRNGEQAIEYLQGTGPFVDEATHPVPALIFLDIKMPRKNGFEVLAWIRERTQFSHIPVAMLTSSRESTDVNQAYSLGANAYLVKPTNFMRLTDMVHRLQEFYRFTDEVFALDLDLKLTDQLSEADMMRF